MIALATVTTTGGCLSDTSQRGEPDHGEIVVISGDEPWMDGQRFRIVVREDDEIRLDKSYRLPVESDRLTIEPGTYEMTVSVAGENVGSREWDVTECQSQFLIYFQRDRSDRVHLGTSDC